MDNEEELNMNNIKTISANGYEIFPNDMAVSEFKSLCEEKMRKGELVEIKSNKITFLMNPRNITTIAIEEV